MCAPYVGGFPFEVKSAFIGAASPNMESASIMYLRAIGVAWFRAEDYQRIREISDDKMIPTFEEFEAKMAARLPQIAARLGKGVILEKATIDPDELLAFARQNHGGQINA